MNGLRRIQPIDVAAILLPIPVILIVLFSFLFQADHALRQFVVPDSSMVQPTTPLFLSIRAGLNDKLKSIYIFLMTPELSDHSTLPAINLHLSGSALDSLESDLPASADIYHKGILETDGSFMRINARYRGDNHWHWLYPKKSWRVKTRKSQVLDRERYLNFINPKSRTIIDSFIADTIAASIGLLAPKHRFVRFYLNNSYLGVYDEVDQINEDFLRNNFRMPGNIYYGESGLFTPMWRDAAAWEMPIKRNAQESGSRKELQRFLDVLTLSSRTDFVTRIDSVLDVHKFLGLYAVDQVIGTARQDLHHNHKLYFDPFTAKLEPVTWDITGNGLPSGPADLPLNVPINPIYGRFFQYPKIVDKRNEMIWKAITGPMRIENIQSIIDSVHGAIRDDVYADLHKDYVDESMWPFRKRPYTNTEFDEHVGFMRRYFDRRVAFLKRSLNDSRIILLSHANHSPRRKEFSLKSVLCCFDVLAGGESASRISSFVLKTHGVFADGSEFSLWRDRNLNGVFDDGDQHVAVSRVVGEHVTFHTDEKLYPGKEKGVSSSAPRTYLPYSLTPAHLNYRYFIIAKNGIASVGRNDKVLEVTCVANNSVTGLPMETLVDEIAECPPLPVADSSTYTVHPWQEADRARPKKMTFAAGIHFLSSDLIVPEGDTLVIESGATLSLGSGVSIVSSGLVRAYGTANRPIKITSSNRDSTWGVLALIGSKSSNSEFTHSIFEHGGRIPVSLMAFTGMINIHSSKVRFDSCAFHNNRIADDAIHTVYSDVSIFSCTFDSIVSDAIDLDYSKGTISDCLFRLSGGDAVDLMTSTPRIQNNYITGARDKGISVGEMSSPVVFNNIVAGNSIGLAIKDQSTPLIVNNVIILNDTGITAYEKNVHYGGGGLGVVANTILQSNGVDFKQDRKSAVEIFSSTWDDESGQSNYIVPMTPGDLENRELYLNRMSDTSRLGGNAEILRQVLPSYSRGTAPVGLVYRLDLKFSKTMKLSTSLSR